jgi:very-short-patch-repair endonuclease
MFGVYYKDRYPICRTCSPFTRSSQEDKILEFLNEHNIKYISNDRTQIKPKEIDIFIPLKNIGIEINGVYYHQDSKNRHLEKHDLCAAKGIQLLQFTDLQINDNFELVKSMILSKLGIFKHKIFARNCVIKDVSKKDSRQFINQNHMQFDTIDKVRLGLYYNDVLVSIMTLGKPRFNKSFEWELIRFCSLENHQILGGFTKLLSHFTKTYSTSIISYANKNWSNGSVYLNKFEKLHDSPPSYNWVNGKGLVYSRYQTQKHKLLDLLPNYDNLLTEYQNMKNHKFFKIYDCGNVVLTYKT